MQATGQGEGAAAGPKKRVVISHDFDGCFALLLPDAVHAIQRYRKSHGLAPMAYTMAFREVAERLREAHGTLMKAITEHAASVDVFCGSNRQSLLNDEYNHDKNGDNGLAFVELPAWCERNTTPAVPWTYQKRLLTDVDLGLPDGTAATFRYLDELPPALQERVRDSGMALRLERRAYTPDGRGEDHRRNNVGRTQLDVFDEGKIRMLEIQIATAVASYPNDAIEFHFLDDRDDLVSAANPGSLIQHFSLPGNLPPNVTLHVTHFQPEATIASQVSGGLFVSPVLSTTVIQGPLRPAQRFRADGDVPAVGGGAGGGAAPGAAAAAGAAAAGPAALHPSRL